MTSRAADARLAAMDDRAIDRGGGRVEWVHMCERCGARMEEQKCKIVCPRCFFIRDCSDP